ncbi:hypothetical protein G6F46_013955 [Rhizopus delemar]|nr:hypothetical protein G6F46_013955 [Rhizopus delemar]
MKYIRTLRPGHAEAFRAQLDTAAEIFIALVAWRDALLRLARVQYLAGDAEDRSEMVQVAADRIGQHHATCGVVDALAVEQAQVGADLEDLESRVRRQQRVEGGIQGLQRSQRFIEHGFEIEHFDDRRGRQLGQIDTGERAGCHG